MTSQLKKFIEASSDLPLKLHRNYKLLRDLDEQVCEKQQEVHQALNQLFNESAPSPAAVETERPTKRARLAAAAAAAAAIGPIDSSVKADIEAKLQNIISLGDEKVAAANQIYQEINRTIEELDKDLKKFINDLHADQTKLGLQPERDSACRSLKIPLDPELVTEKKKGRRKAGAAATAETAPVVTTAAGGIPLDADASEPCYCICQLPSFGEMVACENDNCPIEWFHYGCMMLKEAPKGDWYCPACKPDLWKDKPGLVKAAQKHG